MCWRNEKPRPRHAHNAEFSLRMPRLDTALVRMPIKAKEGAHRSHAPLVSARIACPGSGRRAARRA